MSAGARLAFVSSWLCVVGCQGTAAPLPQWVVTVSTDAPVPQLGDRLLLEILDDDGNPCTGCQRELDSTAASAWPLSFGIVPPAGAEHLHAYARLYRSAAVSGVGQPLDDAYLDGSISLPPAQGVVDVSLLLPAACFGVHATAASHQTCEPQTRGLVPESVGAAQSPLQVGSWSQATSMPCNASVPVGMVCVPGGLLLMGSAAGQPAPPDDVPVPEHLVTVGPFAMDQLEVTVKDVRALLTSGALSPQEAPTAGNATNLCEYLASSDANDAMPVNCVTFASATAICAAQGKRLPTEAEWEMAARNGSAQTSYPWGEDTNVCGYAVVARESVSVTSSTNYSSTCQLMAAMGSPMVTLPNGPVAGGSPTDLTMLGIQDLGGNMSEWVADAFERYDGAYWSSGAPTLADPLCMDTSAGHTGERTVRGGAWGWPPSFLTQGASRSSDLAVSTDPTIGVRCARSM